LQHSNKIAKEGGVILKLQGILREEMSREWKNWDEFDKNKQAVESRKKVHKTYREGRSGT